MSEMTVLDLNISGAPVGEDDEASWIIGFKGEGFRSGVAWGPDALAVAVGQAVVDLLQHLAESPV